MMSTPNEYAMYIIELNRNLSTSVVTSFAVRLSSVVVSFTEVFFPKIKTFKRDSVLSENFLKHVLVSYFCVSLC